MYIILRKKRLFLFSLLALLLILLLTLSLFLFSAAPTLSWQLSRQNILIDPGHGGIFPGKVSSDGTEEKTVNLAIAQNLSLILSQSGAATTLTRTTDTELLTDSAGTLLEKQRRDLTYRTDLAASTHADCFISIHCNSIPSAQWHGAQVFYRPNDPQSQQLAEHIQSQLTRQLKNTTRLALPRQDTFLFEHLSIPSVIVECGFLSNPDECALLNDPLYQQKIAHAIYLGISDYYSQADSSSFQSPAN